MDPHDPKDQHTEKPNNSMNPYSQAKEPARVVRKRTRMIRMLLSSFTNTCSFSIFAQFKKRKKESSLFHLPAKQIPFTFPNHLVLKKYKNNQHSPSRRKPQDNSTSLSIADK